MSVATYVRVSDGPWRFDDVPLRVFDDQLSFEAAPLRPGITPEQVRAELYPDAWRVEQMSRSDPPAREPRPGPKSPPPVT